jgi:tRNA U34 2-thiouridine synthase MnmA/TrmU
MKEKAIVMLSGGLDSRLAVKLMQEKGYEVLALHFKIPFGSGCCDENCSFNFSQGEGVKLKIIDCTRGRLLKEYLDIVRKAEHGRGTCMNPCIDCRIFMLKKAKKFADAEKIKLIATGEVLNQRPMSQNSKAMKIVEKESGLGERLVRPLEEVGAKGRSRKKQIELAKKFKIKYPNSGGGCLLCEKELKDKIKAVLDKKVPEEYVNLVGVGRHFEDSGIILGRNAKENKILEMQKGIKIIPKQPGATALIVNKKFEKKAKELIQKYSKRKIEGFENV